MPAPISEYSKAFHLEARVSGELVDYLVGRDMLRPGEELLEVVSAGKGNMNHTLRIRTKKRSFIAKQSPPWVAKYPQFSAPWDRVLVEAEFYRLTATEARLARRMPRCLGIDEENRILFLQDVPGVNGDAVYGARHLAGPNVGDLAEFLSCLHRSFVSAERSERMANREMRRLNHAHIFSIPLEPDNGLDLDSVLPGLARVAKPFFGDDRLKNTMHRLGCEVYLADGPCLVHGDFFPGSFLCDESGIRVIDPEFCHFGFAEFDVGVFVGHMILAQQTTDLVSRFVKEYLGTPGFDFDTALQIAGCEIIRRLIGYAQLPLTCSLAMREEMLEKARRLVLGPGEIILYG